MNSKQWMGLLLLLTLPSLALAQDARSFAIGGAAAGGSNGPFSIYWNPAGLSPSQGNSNAWSLSVGYSGFNTSNSDSPILRFNSQAALNSNQDPVSQFLQDQGLVAVQYLSYGGGVFSEHDFNSVESQGAYQFFQNQQNGTVATHPGKTYALNDQTTVQDIQTLIISYSTPLPLNFFKFISAGFNLKYSYGNQFSQTDLTGSYTQGAASSYQYNKTTSSSGLGLSTDMGFLAQISDALQAGLMLQNLTSSFNWTAQQQAYTLNTVTGQESPDGLSQAVTVSAPFPYTVKLGLLAEPSGSDLVLNGEVDFANHQTHWKAGLEHYYPANHLVVRLGTFNDPYSNNQLWTIGAGYYTTHFSLNAALITRSLPNIEDSVALGGALDADLRF
ncbi:MAG: hypothetical protein ACREL1_01560 [bacterium]